jgi:hypothetical protein
MGTTLTATLWSGRSSALAHIGDSRAYLLRGGRLRQLTEDHVLHNLVAAAGTSPVLAPMMSRYLDGRPDRSPDLGLREGMPGDRYLLCSDRLSVVVPNTAVLRALESGDEPAQIIELLMGLANGLGGPDNITSCCRGGTTPPFGLMLSISRTEAADCRSAAAAIAAAGTRPQPAVSPALSPFRDPRLAGLSPCRRIVCRRIQRRRPWVNGGRKRWCRRRSRS